MSASKKQIRRFAELPALPSPTAGSSIEAIVAARARVARALLVARHNTGLTQAQLATAAGVRHETISRLESGLHTITEPTAKKLSRALQKHGGLK